MEKTENSFSTNEVETDLKVSSETQNFIFRPWITINGVKVYAKQYGKKAFKIPVA